MLFLLFILCIFVSLYLTFTFPCTHLFSVPGMYPSGFDYMAPPPPYPGPPQNWTPPPQNWASAPAPPGLFSIFIFLTFCLFFQQHPPFLSSLSLALCTPVSLHMSDPITSSRIFFKMNHFEAHCLKKKSRCLIH